MLYTVVSYIPLLEEEVKSKTELCAKGAQDKDSSGDDDNESGQESYFSDPHGLRFSVKEQKKEFLAYYLKEYYPPSRELTTPPPRF